MSLENLIWSANFGMSGYIFMTGFFLGRFDFHIKVVTDIKLPPYKGSTFRGALGGALRRLSCRCAHPDGGMQHNCAYGYLMAASVLHSDKTNAQNPPHPLVLEPPIEQKQIYASGERLLFRAILIGKAINYLTYILLAVQEMGQVGIGRGRGKFALERVESLDLVSKETIYSDKEPLLAIAFPQVTWEDIIEQTLSACDMENIALEFVSPVRLKHNGRLVSQREISFPLLMENLLRRISLLARYYCGANERLDIESLMKIAESVRITDSDLRWYDWERYSAVQQTKMKFGGLLGYITFTGNLLPFLPYLVLGSHIHIGGKTLFGLGNYDVIRMGTGD